MIAPWELLPMELHRIELGGINVPKKTLLDPCVRVASYQPLLRVR